MKLLVVFIQIVPVHSKFDINTYRLHLRVGHHLHQIYFVCMVMVRMGSVAILSVKQSVSIDTMINFDVDGDGHGDRDGTCKQALNNDKL